MFLIVGDKGFEDDNLQLANIRSLRLGSTLLSPPSILCLVLSE